MHQHYLILNKSYHHPLINHLFGDNPLKKEMVESAMLFCAEDHLCCRVVPNRSVFLGPRGELLVENANMTVLY